MDRTGATTASRPRVAITSGDPYGIGPEVALKAIRNPEVRETTIPVLVGSPSVWQRAAALVGLPFEDDSIVLGQERVSLIAPHDSNSPLDNKERSASADAGRASMLAVECAVELCLAGDVDAMVTAPINKEAINLAGYDFPGHTEFIAERAGGEEVLMLMASEGLRVGVVTGHIPLAAVTTTISTGLIINKARLFLASLKNDFGVSSPRLALLGLNPHAGDGGVLGDEDESVIKPAVVALCEDGHLVEGPFPADGFFGTRRYDAFDGVLAMYHDQGLIPFKALTFNRGVNVTTGLSLVRTSPDHGTAFDIAGQGIASESSMVQAVLMAANIFRSRQHRRNHHHLD